MAGVVPEHSSSAADPLANGASSHATVAGSSHPGVGEGFVRLQDAMQEYYKQSVEPLLAENASLRHDIEVLRAVGVPAPVAATSVVEEHVGCNVAVRPRVLQSEPVEFQVTAADGSVGRRWVHETILEGIPYFEAERTRWLQDPAAPRRLHLPPQCSMEGLDAVFRRLYAGRPQPVAEWLREGPPAALGAVLLADMWGMEAEAREASVAVRTVMLDPVVGDAVREAVSGLDVPGPLAAFVNAAPAAAAMDDDEVLKMIQGCATDPSANVEAAAGLLLSRRNLGKNDVNVLLKALQCQAIVEHASGPKLIDSHSSNSGKTTWWTVYEVTRKFASPSGIEWLLDEIQTHAKVQPPLVAQALIALDDAWRRNFLRNYDGADTVSLVNGGNEIIERKYGDLMRVGQEHVMAGELSAEDYLELLRLTMKSRPKLVSADAIQALDELHQLNLLELLPWQDGIKWWTAARFGALHGAARQDAARRLVTKLGHLDHELAGFVSLTLSAGASASNI